MLSTKDCIHTSLPAATYLEILDSNQSNIWELKEQIQSPLYYDFIEDNYNTKAHAVRQRILNITTEILALLKYIKIPSSSKMKISVLLGLIMVPVCEGTSSCRSRENDSVFSSVSSSVIVTLKHSLRDTAVSDPTHPVNRVKSLLTSKHYLVMHD